MFKAHTKGLFNEDVQMIEEEKGEAFIEQELLRKFVTNYPWNFQISI
jgi:hypothetical protein